LACLLLVLLAAGAVFLGPAGAGAATSSVDFESGPPLGQPIENDYISSASVFWTAEDRGFRPYRQVAGVPTHSGTVAAEVGLAHCMEEAGPSGCEFPNVSTLARLTDPAANVTLYAGLFDSGTGSITGTLTGYDSDGNPVASSTAPLGVGITTPITVSSAAGDIRQFELRADGPGAPGVRIGFDDLTIGFNEQCLTVTPPISPTERVVSSPAELDRVLRSDFTGKVFIPRDVEWEMKDCDGKLLRDIPIHSGVSLIGQRGDLGSRPLLYTTDKPRISNESLFVVTGNDVRVEGLHLRGFKLAKDHAIRQDPLYQHAIRVFENFDEKLGRRVVITDNEFDQWTGGGVNVLGSHNATTPKDWESGWVRPDRSDAYLVRVVGNYMHHNVQDGGGYGVTLGCCAYVYVAGNVFDTNRHAVAADGNAYSGYIARFNYVLQGGVMQKSYYNQLLDVHGTANDGYGGYAGEYFLISDNTFRGEQTYGGGFTTRPSFMLRGRTGNPNDHRAGAVNGSYFNDNIDVHDDLDAAVSLKFSSSWTERFGEDHKKMNFHASGNRWNTDYTTEVATGDFDGDGRTDVFLANGTSWFFSRGGIRPWEWLDASRLRTRELGFADVDNDGITDVVHRKANGKLIYLKRGSSPAVSLPSSPVETRDLRFGDFDGDGLTDIFYTRSKEWHVWYGKTHAWAQVGGSVTPISKMLFGDFDQVPGTDIAAVRNNQWSYSSGATAPWARLNSKRTDSLENAVAADFDGNGISDIAFIEGKKWTYSRDGRSALTPMRKGDLPAYKPLLVGNFVPDGGAPRAQVASWVREIDHTDRQTHLPVYRYGLRLNFWPGVGSGDAFRALSKQNMR
jgi:hypothetical protein